LQKTLTYCKCFFQAVEKVLSQQSFLSLSKFVPVKTAKKENEGEMQYDGSLKESS
jgi:hypothetical protein